LPRPRGRGPSVIALAIACLLLVSCGGAPGKPSQPAKIPHIGYLDFGPIEYASSPAEHPFSQGLRELGYVEGRTVIVDYRWAENDDQRLHDLAAELVSAKVDVLVTEGAPTLDAVRQAGATMPIV